MRFGHPHDFSEKLYLTFNWMLCCFLLWIPVSNVDMNEWASRVRMNLGCLSNHNFTYFTIGVITFVASLDTFFEWCLVFTPWSSQWTNIPDARIVWHSQIPICLHHLFQEPRYAYGKCAPQPPGGELDGPDQTDENILHFQELRRKRSSQPKQLDCSFLLIIHGIILELLIDTECSIRSALLFWNLF